MDILTFKIVDKIYAINLDNAIKIIRNEKIFPSPVKERFIVGNILYKTHIVPVMDFTKYNNSRIEKNNKEYDFILITNINKIYFAILINKIGDIIKDVKIEKRDNILNEVKLSTQSIIYLINLENILLKKE